MLESPITFMAMESPLSFMAGGRDAAGEEEAGTLRLAVFDLDGTLIDSEENHYESDRIMLSRRGIAFSREDKKAFVGKDIIEMVRRIKANFDLEDDVMALLDEKKRPLPEDRPGQNKDVSPHETPAGGPRLTETAHGGSHRLERPYSLGNS